MRKRISRTRLVKFLKQQGFKEYKSDEELDKHMNEDSFFNDKFTGILCVYTKKGSYFSLGEDFSAFSIGTFHVDIDTERDVFAYLLYELFGHVKVDGDDISAWYTTDEYAEVVEIRNKIIGKAA